MGNESTQESTTQTVVQTVEDAENMVFGPESSDEASSPDGLGDLGGEHPKSGETQAADSGEEVPAEETGETGKAQDKPAEKDGEQADGSEKAEEGKGDEAADEAAELAKNQRELEESVAGVENAQALTNEALMERDLEKDRFIQELTQRISTKDADYDKALNDVGRKVIETRQGLKVVTSDDAKAVTADDVDLSGVSDGLSDTQKANLVEAEVDINALVGSLAVGIAQQFASQVTPVSGQLNDEVISQYEQNETWYEFLSAKSTSGELRFPDAESDINKPVMDRVINSTDPIMVHMREQAQKSKIGAMALWQMGYEKTARINQVPLAKAAAAKRQRAKSTEDKTQAATVEGSGGGGGTNAQGQGGNGQDGSFSDKLGDFVVNSDRDDSPDFFTP